MRYTSFTLVVAAWACSPDAPLTAPPPALDAPGSRVAAATYTVVALPTLGGTSRGNSIDNRGSPAGYSTPLGTTTRHAALWVGGLLTDLGTLGGPNSSVAWQGQNNRGTIVGISETGALDPLGEAWSCSAFFPTVTYKTCRGLVWENGSMTALGTLGGNNSYAASSNSRGQAVGWAETPVHDPTCNAPQVLQFRAVMWDTRKHSTTELPPVRGDSTSAATAINDAGQVVGISGACDVAVGNLSATHAVMWEKGSVTDLGNLGGAKWHTPTAINPAGDVVGFSDLPGDAVMHAFLWTKRDGMRDLGTLPGDAISQANGINARGQVVGISCGAVCRAFFWEKGVMYDLNTLMAPGFADFLSSAQAINDAGNITGRVVEAATGRRLAFVASPNGAP